MSEYIKKPRNQSHTLDNNPQSSRQASFSDIFQKRRNNYIEKKIPQETWSIQMHNGFNKKL